MNLRSTFTVASIFTRLRGHVVRQLHLHLIAPHIISAAQRRLQRLLLVLQGAPVQLRVVVDDDVVRRRRGLWAGIWVGMQLHPQDGFGERSEPMIR